MRKRRKEDINFRIKSNIRSRIGHELRKANISRKGKIKYLDIEMETYRKWLESQFDENMSWKNYGKYWHIDHVVPCAAFKFKDEEDDAIYECFNWKNTRPLYGPENSSKSDTIDNLEIVKHKIIVNSFIVEYAIDEPLYDGIDKNYYIK